MKGLMIVEVLGYDAHTVHGVQALGEGDEGPEMVLGAKILDMSSTEVSRSSQGTRSQYNGSALHALCECVV